jgi:hypothetical protein
MKKLVIEPSKSTPFISFDFVRLKDQISINWIYDLEDEDNLEYGEDFQDDLKNLTFKFKTK